MLAKFHIASTLLPCLTIVIMKVRISQLKETKNRQSCSLPPLLSVSTTPSRRVAAWSALHGVHAHCHDLWLKRRPPDSGVSLLTSRRCKSGQRWSLNPNGEDQGLIAFFHIGFRVICVIFQRYAEFPFFHGPGCKMYPPTMC
jgi:hypothetical protein